jgi:hypothetical protein
MCMEDRIAFTAKYWGDKAVVCRSSEDCPGPAVDQEFGEFETWTQAKGVCRAAERGSGDLAHRSRTNHNQLDPAHERTLARRQFTGRRSRGAARNSGWKSAAAAVCARGTGAGIDVLPDCALQAKRKHRSSFAECAKRIVRCNALRVPFGTGRLRARSGHGEIGAAACGVRGVACRMPWTRFRPLGLRNQFG